MSKDSKSAQGSSTSTPSKKSFSKQHHGKIGSGSIDKRPTSPSSKDSKDKKCSSRSKKIIKDSHHKKKDAAAAQKKDEEKAKKESEKEKKDSTTKNLKKEKKEQNSQLPTEFEEVNAARRPAISKTKRKHLVVEEDAVTPVTGQSSSNVISAPPEHLPAGAADEGLPTPQLNNDGKCSGSFDPDSSGRVPGSKQQSGDPPKTPENDQSGPLPGIKLSKELIKHGSKENVKGSSNKEKPPIPTKSGSKETIVPKTLLPGTPGVMEKIPMSPVNDDGHEKKQ